MIFTNFFYAKKILFSCSLKCAIDHDKAISNKFFIKVLNYPKRKKHPVFRRVSFYSQISLMSWVVFIFFTEEKDRQNNLL